MRVYQGAVVQSDPLILVIQKDLVTSRGWNVPLWDWMQPSRWGGLDGKEGMEEKVILR